MLHIELCTSHSEYLRAVIIELIIKLLSNSIQKTFMADEHCIQIFRERLQYSWIEETINYYLPPISLTFNKLTYMFNFNRTHHFYIPHSFDSIFYIYSYYYHPLNHVIPTSLRLSIVTLPCLLFKNYRD